MWPFDQNNQQVYQQYAQAYDTGNFNGFDPYQATGHVQQFMQGAPLETQQQLFQQHFSQMPYEQRAAFVQQMPQQYYADPNDPFSMAQNFLRLGQEQPNVVQRILSHPILLGGALGLAGLIAKHMLSHHHQNNQQYGFNQGYQQDQYQQNQYQQNQYQQNQYQQEQYLQQEVNELRREDQELRREVREEEREQHHHHRRENYY